MPARDQVVDVAFHFRERLTRRRPGRGNQRVVCGDLGVVEGPRPQREIGGADDVGKLGLDAGDRVRDLAGLGVVALGKVRAIGARIGRQPMRFVEGLANLENDFGSEAEPAAGVYLQVGERVR
jgi:hypothetical protein